MDWNKVEQERLHTGDQERDTYRIYYDGRRVGEVIGRDDSWRHQMYGTENPAECVHSTALDAVVCLVGSLPMRPVGRPFAPECEHPERELFVHDFGTQGYLRGPIGEHRLCGGCGHDFGRVDT